MHYETSLYYGSSLRSKSGDNLAIHEEMSKNSSSLVEYKIDSSLIEAALNDFINDKASTMYKYTNTQLGKMMGGKAYGENSLNTLKDAF